MLDSHLPLLSPFCSVLGFPRYHTPAFPSGCFLSLAPLDGFGGDGLSPAPVAGGVSITGFTNGLWNWCHFAERNKKRLFSGTSVVERRENCVPSWRFLENTLLYKLSWNDSSYICFQSCFFSKQKGPCLGFLSYQLPFFSPHPPNQLMKECFLCYSVSVCAVFAL